MLRYYWNHGKDISEREEENKYGSAFFATLSRDLKREMPDATGLSERSLIYAKNFYQLYQRYLENLQQVVADFQNADYQNDNNQKQNLP